MAKWPTRTVRVNLQPAWFFFGSLCTVILVVLATSKAKHKGMEKGGMRTLLDHKCMVIITAVLGFIEQVGSRNSKTHSSTPLTIPSIASKSEQRCLPAGIRWLAGKVFASPLKLDGIVRQLMDDIYM